MSGAPRATPDADRAARDLPGGLRVRWATKDEAEKVAALNGRVFRRDEQDATSHWAYNQTLDMMSGEHPLISADDFAIVEDVAAGEFVAGTCLLRQTWRLGDVSFPVGRPELVATREEYRNRGLVRALFALIHERSDERGDLAQGITGIPYFYRQFGYEFAADLEGGRTVYPATVPARQGDAAEPFRLEPATREDLTFIRDLYEAQRQSWLLSAELELGFLDYAHQLAAKDRAPSWQLHTIRDQHGARRGFVRVNSKRWDRTLAVWDVAVTPETALSAVAPALLRALVSLGEAAAPMRPEAGAFTSLFLMLGREHPLYDVLGASVARQESEPYAWYIRVPDLPAFLMHVKAVLEQRIAGSPFVGYSGELRLNFYQGGLRLVFEGGLLRSAEPWRQPAWGTKAQASFPPLVFYQLVFGFRSLPELQASLTDVRVDADTAPLLKQLFPKRLSRLDFFD